MINIGEKIPKKYHIFQTTPLEYEKQYDEYLKDYVNYILVNMRTPYNFNKCTI